MHVASHDTHPTMERIGAATEDSSDCPAPTASTASCMALSSAPPRTCGKESMSRVRIRGGHSGVSATFTRTLPFFSPSSHQNTRVGALTRTGFPVGRSAPWTAASPATTLARRSNGWSWSTFGDRSDGSIAPQLPATRAASMAGRMVCSMLGCASTRRICRGGCAVRRAGDAARAATASSAMLYLGGRRKGGGEKGEGGGQLEMINGLLTPIACMHFHRDYTVPPVPLLSKTVWIHTAVLVFFSLY